MSISNVPSSGAGNVGMSSGLNMLQNGGAQLSAAGTQAASKDGTDMMAQIQQTAAMQMKFQTEMGLIQMIVKMNEALAKMFKAIGEAIKGLA
ncbi:hypothetical protein J2W49_001918 [Hydrogenophaga palleronii]|uniref:Uncharacterized protein n=1 Tax=Hydrogenophaga palleronii TaxID=65655 RepID=A0ABU1WL42_9BURK|nr:hypothetical protein [Hydrogenophaga palleronii]MDR7149963.1 hypothetical protein [Hydrogenophaga palleronii]